MAYREIFDDIRKGKLGSLYLFYGPEEYIKGQALLQVTTALIQDGFRDLNYQLMDGADTTADVIISASETLPFMSDKRLVIVKDYSGFGSRKTAEEEGLRDYLGRVPESTCLIFYQHGDVDKGRILYKAIKKHGQCIEFERLKPPELAKWTSSMFVKHGKEIGQAELNHFLMLVGNRLEDVFNEIQKLVAYTGETSRIPRDAIDKLVTPLPEHTVFQLLDRIAARQRGEALLLLEELLDAGQAVLGIITLIGRQLKNMLLCKDYMEKGYSQSTIVELLKIHPYAAKKCMEQSRNFSPEQLRKSLSACLELDMGIKSGQIKERLGMEMLIIKMCGG